MSLRLSAVALAAMMFPLECLGAAGAARAGTIRALVCRGTPGIDLRLSQDPSPSDARKVRMTLRYRRALNPGWDYETLQPGECTWNPRGYPAVMQEPGYVFLDVDREAQPYSAPPPRQIDTTIDAAVFFPDPITLPRYLGDPRHYWMFYVDDATMVAISSGAFRSTAKLPTYTTIRGSTTSAVASIVPSSPVAGPRDGQSTTRAQPGAVGGAYEAGGRRVSNIGSVGLVFNGIDRGWKRTALRFSARTSAKPEVSWSTSPPKLNAKLGQLEFAPGNAWGVRQTASNNLVADFATETATQLPPGTKIYFLINVPGDANNRLQQYSGELTTVSQTVTVRFQRIHVLNDSDKMSAGDLSFTFYIGSSSDITACDPSRECKAALFGKEWESGSDNAISNTVTMRNAPDKIHFWVHGWDDDSDVSGRNWVAEYGPMGTEWTATPGSSSHADWNVAGLALDVGILPDKTRIGFPFTLRSRDGYVLMFEVTGEAEVTRE